MVCDAAVGWLIGALVAPQRRWSERKPCETLADAASREGEEMSPLESYAFERGREQQGCRWRCAKCRPAPSPSRRSGRGRPAPVDVDDRTRSLARRRRRASPRGAAERTASRLNEQAGAHTWLLVTIVDPCRRRRRPAQPGRPSRSMHHCRRQLRTNLRSGGARGQCSRSRAGDRARRGRRSRRRAWQRRAAGKSKEGNSSVARSIGRHRTLRHPSSGPMPQRPHNEEQRNDCS